jgi:ankyrin repeat protein
MIDRSTSREIFDSPSRTSRGSFDSNVNISRSSRKSFDSPSRKSRGSFDSPSRKSRGSFDSCTEKSDERVGKQREVINRRATVRSERLHSIRDGESPGAMLIAALQKVRVTEENKLLSMAFSISECDLAAIEPNTGETLLHLAAKRANKQMCELFLSKNIDVGAVDRKGHTALHAACSGDADEGALAVVTVLLAAGVPRKKMAKDGNTAKQIAMLRGHMMTVAVLSDRQWAAVTAASSGDVPELKRLLSRRSVGGYDELVVNSVAPGAVAPLMAAARKGHIEALVLLLGAGANADQASATGQLPIDVAFRNGHMDAVELLATNAAAGTKCAVRAAELKAKGLTIGNGNALAALVASARTGAPKPMSVLATRAEGVSVEKAAATGLVAKLRAKQAAAAAVVGEDSRADATSAVTAGSRLKSSSATPLPSKAVPLTAPVLSMSPRARAGCEELQPLHSKSLPNLPKLVPIKLPAALDVDPAKLCG